MERKIERRDFLNLAVSGLAAFAAACGPNSDSSAQVVDSPEGRVVQWEKDELIVLVSGAQPRYAPGDTVKLSIVVNNQGLKAVQARIRTRLLGRGQQAVAEAQVSPLSVGPEAAATVEKELPLPRDLAPGEYTLQIELPPWSLSENGRESSSGGGKISLLVQVAA